MQVPKSFEAMCRVFHQDADIAFSSSEELIAFGFRQVDSSEREVIKKFVSEMLVLSGDEMQKIWWSTSADLVFQDEEALRAFLRKVVLAH